LFEEDDSWVLVDYKAITVANERERKRVEKKYKGQLQIYAESLKQVGIKVKDSMIITC
jgi:ATP-dependent exoDNAse (exonuclease V) beta subunit